MDILRDNQLIFGRLLTISEPHLIARYNKALEAFGLPVSQLNQIDIDMTGFSPQIAEELDDFGYLDPQGVNRRFIILTPEQEFLPVVHTQFSNTGGLMHEFFSQNARAIHAVTIKDVLYGEIEDSVSVVEDVDDLLSINEVTFRVLSAEDMLGKAAELRQLSDRLVSVPNAWRDDDLLERMVDLAKQTGDIRQNALVPDKLVFRHDAFWAGHFGGIFVFIDDKSTTVVCDPSVPGFRKSRPWQVSYISIHDHRRIFDFLTKSKRIEFPRASWVEKSGFFQHRAEMVLKKLILKHNPETDFEQVDGIWLQTWMHNNARIITRDGTYPFLQEMERLIGKNGRIKMKEVDPKLRFAIVRADPKHPDKWLTNRLIATLTPYDYLSRFVFDKQGFYKDYETWSKSYRHYVAADLVNTYLNDRSGLRRRLYGIKGN